MSQICNDEEVARTVAAAEAAATAAAPSVGASKRATLAKMGHEEAAFDKKKMMAKRRFSGRPHRWRRALPGQLRIHAPRERLARENTNNNNNNNQAEEDMECDTRIELHEDESGHHGHLKLEESMRAAGVVKNLLFHTLTPEAHLSAEEVHEALNTIIFSTKAVTLLSWCKELALEPAWDAGAHTLQSVPVYSGGELTSPQEVALFLIAEWLMHWDGGTKLRIVPETNTLLREILDICDAPRESFEAQFASAALESAAHAMLGKPEDVPEDPQDDFQGTFRSAGVSVESVAASAEADLLGFLDAESARRGSACWFGLSASEFAAERLSMERRGSVASWASAQSLDSAASLLASPRSRRAASPSGSSTFSSSLSPTKQLRTLLGHLRLRASSAEAINLDNATPREIRRGLLTQLLRLRPSEAALQLTLLVQDCICDEIRVFELGRAVRAGRVRAAPCPNLNRLVSVFEVVASWVETDVLAHAHQNASSRVRALLFFLHAAIACRELRSFHLLFALVAGLGQTTLSWVWKLAPAKERVAFEKLQRVVSPRQNYLVYRADLSKSPTPGADPHALGCMPFLGIWLKDASVMLEINTSPQGRDALSAFSAYALGKEAMLCQHSYAACPRDDFVRELLCALLQSTTINADFKTQLSTHELRRSSPRLSTFLSRKGISSPLPVA